MAIVINILISYIKNELIKTTLNNVQEIINNNISELITTTIVTNIDKLGELKTNINNIFTQIEKLDKLDENILTQVRDQIKLENKEKKENKQAITNNNIVIDYFLFNLLPNIKKLFPNAEIKLEIEDTIIDIIKTLLNYMFNYPKDKDTIDCINNISTFIIKKNVVEIPIKCTYILGFKLNSAKDKIKELSAKIITRITNFISELKKLSEDITDENINKFIENNKILLLALDIKNTVIYKTIKCIIDNIDVNGTIKSNIDVSMIPDIIPSNIKANIIKLLDLLKAKNTENINEEVSTIIEKINQEVSTIIKNITEPYFDKIKKTINDKINNKYYLDNEEIYYEKYIKYKSKYLELKNQMNQTNQMN
jgi:hypothetical protein